MHHQSSESNDKQKVAVILHHQNYVKLKRSGKRMWLSRFLNKFGKSRTLSLLIGLELVWLAFYLLTVFVFDSPIVMLTIGNLLQIIISGLATEAFYEYERPFWSMVFLTVFLVWIAICIFELIPFMQSNLILRDFKFLLPHHYHYSRLKVVL